MRKRITKEPEKVGSSSLSLRKVSSLPKETVITKKSRGFIDQKTMTLGYNHVAYLTC